MWKVITRGQMSVAETVQSVSAPWGSVRFCQRLRARGVPGMAPGRPIPRQTPCKPPTTGDSCEICSVSMDRIQDT